MPAKWFDYAASRTVQAALEPHAREPRALPLAGGAHLPVRMRYGRREAGLLVDVKHSPEANELGCDDSGTLRRGAAVPCCAIYESELVRRRWPARAEVAAVIGGIPAGRRGKLRMTLSPR